MKPEKKENIYFSYLALILLGVLVITLVVLAYLENRNYLEPGILNDQDTQIPKANTLTEDKVKKELELVSETGQTTKPKQLIEQKITSSNTVGDETVSTSASTTPTKSTQPVFAKSENAVNSDIINLLGTIYKIQDGLIIINNSDGFTRVFVTDKTEISINGKKIGIESLKIAQNINVEGLGDITKRELTASTIHLLGEIQVIPY